MNGARRTILQAVATAVVGLIAIRAAGAPASALVVQAAALFVGGLVAAVLAFNPWRPGPKAAAAVICVCLAPVFATLGEGAPGVHRWIAGGPIMVQPASILLPFVIWSLAVTRVNWWAGALAGAFGLVLAVQPDAASATGLLLALVALAAVKGRATAQDVTALSMAALATVWSWTRIDPLPSVAHVERVVPEAFSANPLIGIAAGAALVLLPLPFVLSALEPKDRAVATGLAGLWIGLVAGNLFGNYPAPVVGYGASLVVGWLASLGLCLSRPGPAPAPGWTISPRR